MKNLAFLEETFGYLLIRKQIRVTPINCFEMSSLNCDEFKSHWVPLVPQLGEA